MPRHISQENLDVSTKFTGILSNLLEFIDTVSQHIPEGKYLEIMNDLKFLNDNKPCDNPLEVLNTLTEEINSDEIVRQHRQRITYTPVDIIQNYNQKFICPDCDTVVKHLAQHRQTLKCQTIAQTKKMSAWSKRTQTKEIKSLMGIICKIEEKLNKFDLYNNIITNFNNNYKSITT